MGEVVVMTEEVAFPGHEGDWIEGFWARPVGGDTHGSVVVIHHMPGYDQETKEIVYRFARHGYSALMPNLYFREAPNASPDDAAAIARSKGGVPDERLVGDVGGARQFLLSQPSSNGKAGVIGYCSGGRQCFLAACSLKFDAAVDCYGAFVVRTPPSDFPLNVKGILSLAPQLSCPVLGLFGGDDKFPSPDEVAELEAELTRLNKPHDFHSYEGAGHAFFSTGRPSYRPEAAADGWEKIFAFFGKELS